MIVMAIFKIFKPLYTVKDLREKLLYLQGKKILDSTEIGGEYYDYSVSPLGVISGGINAAASDVEGQAKEIKFFHDLFGDSGKILGYHVMLDFNCELNPDNTAIVGSVINEFWSRERVQWVQGLHVYEGDGFYWPHLHMVISTRILDGPMKGHLLNMNKALIARYRQHVNDVLNGYGISGIPCRNIDTIRLTPHSIGNFDVSQLFL